MIWFACLLWSRAAGAQPPDVAPQGPAADGADASEGESAPEPEPSEESPPAPAPRTYTLPPLDAPLPSALRVAPPTGEAGDPELDEVLRQAGLDPDDFTNPKLIRGRWFVRPSFTVAQLIGGDSFGPVALRSGLTAGRRFTTLELLPVQLHAEVGLRGSLPAFGARGHRAEAYAQVGPWLGPVRLHLGAHVRHERERWHRRTVELAAAALAGPDVGAAVDLGPIQLDAGLIPLFHIHGDRQPARAHTPTLPVLGDETLYSAGVGVILGSLGLRVHGSWRDTAVGSLLEVGAALSLHPRAE